LNSDIPSIHVSVCWSAIRSAVGLQLRRSLVRLMRLAASLLLRYFALALVARAAARIVMMIYEVD